VAQEKLAEFEMAEKTKKRQYKTSKLGGRTATGVAMGRISRETHPESAQKGRKINDRVVKAVGQNPYRKGISSFAAR
jgi:hypothetical protein